MKIFVFIALKIVEIGALSLIWWIPWLVGRTKFAKKWTSASEWQNSADDKWTRGAIVIGQSFLLLLIAILILAGLVFGLYSLGRAIIFTNWRWASQIIEALK